MSCASAASTDTRRFISATRKLVSVDLHVVTGLVPKRVTNGAERKRGRNTLVFGSRYCLRPEEVLSTRVEKPPPRPYLMLVRFIPPCSPVLSKEPPPGPEWLHEVKFDGWRVQIHKQGKRVKLYSRNGKDLADRFSMLRDACLYLPDCVIDGELVACDTDGRPDFSAITKDHANLCIWCFDLLAHSDGDMREKPLVERKAALRDLLIVVMTTGSGTPRSSPTQ